MRYNAFISYSQAADGKLAPALHSALHQFAKPWYRLRALHIFRDKTTLHPTPHLWGAIQSALDESAYFILMASPKAATSIWVQRDDEFALSSQGQFLALSGSEPKQKPDTGNDYYVEVWDVRGKRRVARIPQMDVVAAVGFDPGGKVVWTIAGNFQEQRRQVEVWDWANQKLVSRLAHEEEINQIRFSSQSPVLATISANRVHVWDFQTGGLLSQLTDAGNVRDLRFSPDGHHLLTGSADGTAAMWLWRTEDLRTEACKRLGRNLTLLEWQIYLGTEPYQETCRAKN